MKISCKGCGAVCLEPTKAWECPCGTGKLSFGYKSESRPASALDRQEGGQHYKSMAIQPVQYIHANGLGFIEGSVVKYVSRWRAKGGVEDLKKARHFLDLLIEMEGKQ